MTRPAAEPLADQVIDFIETHLDVELTTWQDHYLRAIYGTRPDAAG